MLVALAIGVAIAAVVGLLLTYGLRWLGRRINFDLHLRASWRSPVVLLAVAVALRWVLYRAKDEQEWTGPVSDLLDIAIIGIIGWIVLLIVTAIGSTVMDTDPRAGSGQPRLAPPADEGSRCSNGSPAR